MGLVLRGWRADLHHFGGRAVNLAAEKLDDLVDGFLHRISAAIDEGDARTQRVVTARLEVADFIGHDKHRSRHVLALCVGVIAFIVPIDVTGRA